MTKSESVMELAKALTLAQGEMEGAKKDSTNPHFRSAYADLASVWAAIRGPLTKHGLSVTQFPRLTNVGTDAWLVEVETMLLHVSGEWITDTLALPLSSVTAQGAGSAITYARRYSLMAVAGIAPEDDDANAAVGQAKGASYSAPRRVEVKTVTLTQQKKLFAVAKDHGWDDIQLKAYLSSFGWHRSHEVPAESFDDVLSAIECGPDAAPVAPAEPAL
jgi:hypothetical protein